jgi:hypothetical protein
MPRSHVRSTGITMDEFSKLRATPWPGDVRALAACQSLYCTNFRELFPDLALLGRATRLCVALLSILQLGDFPQKDSLDSCDH